jgi:hypothetical protein
MQALMKRLMRLPAIPLSPKVRGKRLIISCKSRSKLLMEQLAISLMKLLAIPLGCQKTTTKWLVIRQQAAR